MGCVAFCCLQDGNKIGPRICGALCFLKFAKLVKKMKEIKLLKSYRMCRFLPPPGRQEKWSGNLWCLVFFDIRKKMKKMKTNINVKII